jgi:hypothetical protein
MGFVTALFEEKTRFFAAVAFTVSAGADYGEQVPLAVS